MCCLLNSGTVILNRVRITVSVIALSHPHMVQRNLPEWQEKLIAYGRCCSRISLQDITCLNP